jgi:hypothetical protein
MVENQAGTTLKIIRTDDAEEFKSAHVRYLQQFGVLIETTAGYSSSSSGAVERVHLTLFDMVRLMLIPICPHRSGAKQFQQPQKSSIVYQQKQNANSISPHEAWFGKKPSIKHLRVFSCVANQLRSLEKETSRPLVQLNAVY